MNLAKEEISLDLKVLCFEYVVKKLLAWHREVSMKEDNDLSTLKVLKLLFFVSAANSRVSSSENLLLDEVFTKFHAMPYGHVESDIYEELRKKKGVLTYYKVSTLKTEEIKDSSNLTLDLPLDIRTSIDKSIEILKEINNTFILASAFKLVDLSHAWYSWQFHYMNTTLRSVKIPSEFIKKENKVFSFFQF